MTVADRIVGLQYELRRTGLWQSDGRLLGDFRPSVLLNPYEEAELLHGVSMGDLHRSLYEGEVEFRGFKIFVRPERAR